MQHATVSGCPELSRPEYSIHTVPKHRVFATVYKCSSGCHLDDLVIIVIGLVACPVDVAVHIWACSMRFSIYVDCMERDQIQLFGATSHVQSSWLAVPDAWYNVVTKGGHEGGMQLRPGAACYRGRETALPKIFYDYFNNHALNWVK